MMLVRHKMEAAMHRWTSKNLDMEKIHKLSNSFKFMNKNPESGISIIEITSSMVKSR